MGAGAHTIPARAPNILFGMYSSFHLNPLVAVLLAAALGTAGCKPRVDAEANAAPQVEEPLPRATAAAGSHPDLSGRTRFGNASFYADKFAGREMADGGKMDPTGDNAASKTLPLGTTARVTNIATGESAMVTIRDRGPYVKGRIVDLSPSTAQKIGITEESGVAKVKVAPIVVPLPDGSTRRGVATLDEKP